MTIETDVLWQPDERNHTNNRNSLRSSIASSSDGALTEQSSLSSSLRQPPPLEPLHLPRHSDFTIPTSNVRGLSPPQHLEEDDEHNRRTIFGNAVKRKYTGTEMTENAEDSSSLYQITTTTTPNHHNTPIISDFATSSNILPDNSNHTLNHSNNDSLLLSPLTPPPTTTTKHSNITERPHETIHAQSLLLGLAFAAVWSPSNLMAPNLTEMANDFAMNDNERDLYLGSYCALATGVLSFPIGAGIGILADLWSRQKLFCFTVAAGGLSSIATAFCQEYWQLFLCRWMNGGFMSASVPVAFSFLGDLFATEERNAASSGLTAMMGLGIMMGQVYAGVVGSTQGWPHAFYVSGIVTLCLAVLCWWLVQEPIRGGKEKVLQDMIQAGTRYERKLTWQGFRHAMRHNKSNSILLWQGFFSSLPWGISFVFLNDYLSQEKGFSVPDATYLVFLLGIGCGFGGVLGGYWGQKVQAINRSYLPVFMSISTIAGALPFLGLLNISFTNVHGAFAFTLAVSSGLIASLPSVNVRPCLINVNPPETRGASLTAANLLINLGRGVGPGCVTLMGSIWHVSRRYAFNVTLVLFWAISAFQLLLLAKTLPKDQDAMETELALYAEEALRRTRHSEETASLMSIEEPFTSFDGGKARQTYKYMRQGFKEFREEVQNKIFHCGEIESSSEEEENSVDTEDIFRRRDLWRRQQEQQQNASLDEASLQEHDRAYATETTPLVV